MAETLKNYTVSLVRNNTTHQIVVAATSQRDALDQVNYFTTAVISLRGKRHRRFADRLRDQ